MLPIQYTNPFVIKKQIKMSEYCETYIFAIDLRYGSDLRQHKSSEPRHTCYLTEIFLIMYMTYFDVVYNIIDHRVTVISGL